MLLITQCDQDRYLDYLEAAQAGETHLTFAGWLSVHFPEEAQ